MSPLSTLPDQGRKGSTPRVLALHGGSMAPYRHLFGGVVLLALLSGCALEEVRSKNKFGSEWRHSGSRSTAEERYSVEPGFEFKWDKGISTGLSYRRRDIDNGSGDSDNGLFVDVSFPLWKKPKGQAKTAERIEALERRLAELEAAQAERVAGAFRAAGGGKGGGGGGGGGPH